MCGPNGLEESWRLFAETGKIGDYLDYKAQQRLTNALGKDSYAADGDNGAGPAPGQSRGGRPDPDPPDA